MDQTQNMIKILKEQLSQTMSQFNAYNKLLRSGFKSEKALNNVKYSKFLHGIVFDVLKTLARVFEYKGDFKAMRNVV